VLLAGQRVGRVQDRVLLNDERVLDAAVELIVDSGWGGFHPAGVAAATGLSKRAVLERAPDRSTLAAATWSLRAWPALQESIDAVLDAGGVAPSTVHVAAPGAEASGPALLEAVQPLLRPSPELAAATELLLIAGFQPVLQQAVEETLGPHASRLLSGNQPSDSGTLMGQRGYLVMLVGGLLMLALRRREMPVPDLEPFLDRVASALHAAPTPRSLPVDDAPHMDAAPPIHTGEPALDRLLQATVTLVGEHGFDDTTVSMICRSANVTQGFVFGRYGSKLELFLDANRRHQAAGYSLNTDFVSNLAERHGQGGAEAVIIRELQRPERRLQNTVFLEPIRMSWHQPDLRDVQEAEVKAAFAHEPKPRTKRERSEAYARHHTDAAIGIGASLTPWMYPQAHVLPYDVVMVPLLG